MKFRIGFKKSNMKPEHLPIVGSLVMLLGALLICVGCYSAISTIIFISTAEETAGTILHTEITVRKQKNKGQKYSEAKWVLIEYRTPQGDEFQKRIEWHRRKTAIPSRETGIMDPAKDPNRGKQVRVYYDREDPSEMRIRTFRNLWGNTLVFVVIGTMLFVIGLMMRRKAQ